MRCSNLFDYNNILKYYAWSNYHPLQASAFVNQYGDVYFGFFQSLLSDLLDDDLSVLFGYYASDLKIAIKKIDAFYKDKNQVHDIVTCNALMAEFMHDLLLFDKYRDTAHFLAIFGKYQKQLIGDPGNKICAYIESFSNTYSVTVQENQDAHKKTLNAINFIILHEWAHLEREIIGKVIKAFRDTEDFVGYADHLSDKQLEESACDYTALFFAASPEFPLSKEIQEKLGCSATTSLTHGIILHHIDALFQLLKLGFRMGISDRGVTINQIFREMERQLDTRCKTLILMAKYSESNDNPILGYVDLKKALSDASTLVKSFVDCLSDAIRLLADKSDEISAKGELEVFLTLNKSINQDEIWFLIK